MKSVLALSGLLALATALPANDLVARVNNLDILIPVNGSLQRAPDQAAQKRAILARMSNEPLQRRSGCDGPLQGPYALAQTGEFSCTAYCEKSLDTHFQGDAVKVSDDVNCDVATCPQAHSYSTTVTYSFSVNIGLDSKQTEGDTLKVGASWTWTDSKTSMNSYGFNPVQGDVGHIVFRPWLTKSCGIATSWGVTQNIDTGPVDCDGDTLIGEDDNACGYVPNVKQDGEADGTYTFCHTDTGVGC